MLEKQGCNRAFIWKGMSSKHGKHWETWALAGDKARNSYVCKQGNCLCGAVA